jgi:DNA-directed RNA polymerase subunit RPC12/RpoP
MPVPEWAGELREKMFEKAKGLPDTSTLITLDMNAITCFSTLFAEWFVREGDVLLHLFPRNGQQDQWTDGHYLPKCQRCHADVPLEIAKAKKPCPQCSHLGLVYVPGRREAKADCRFPDNIRELIKEAVDAAWMGDAAIDEVQELGAWVVQFQSAKNTAVVLGGNKFVDKVCEELDKRLEARR